MKTSLPRLLRASFAAAVCLVFAMPLNASAPATVQTKKTEGVTVLDLRPAMNQSVFDDGIDHNKAGGWTDEGNNDFHCWPEMKFGAMKHRGYFFDFVDPASNGGKNLLMTGTDECWPELPRTIDLRFEPVKSRFVFLMHSEGRVKGKPEVCGKLTIGYADGTSAEMPLRMGKELADWYQGSWWGSCEEMLPNAPEALAKSGFIRKKYEEAGGKNFERDMLEFTRAVRWPVTQGLNVFSANWNIPVVFWGLRWENPHADKAINSIKLESSGDMLIALAGVTFSDVDFSLDRQKEGAMLAPPPPHPDFFEKVKAKDRAVLLPQWLELPWMKGLKSVQVRSDRIVTARVDQLADFLRLKEPQCYSVTSSDDPDFKEPVHPVRISRFSKGAGYKEPEVFVDHFMHLEMPKPFKPGKTYALELGSGILPERARVVSKAEFSLKTTPNPSFKINQVGYSGAAGVKLAYLSSYLGDGQPVDLSGFKTFEIRSSDSGKTVFKGEIKPHAERDDQGLDKLYSMDLSGFAESGRFHIWVEGLGRSYDFLNGDAAAEKMYELAHAGLLFQRSGFELKEPYDGKWTRPLSHNKIYVTKANLTHPSMTAGKVDPNDPASPYYVPEGPLEIRGGHYDAGDFDLRPMHINIPEFLMSLYEGCPKKFRDGQAKIPEKANGIPDILDEAAWNLLSLEYIQDYAGKVRGLEGGVAPGMETYIHPGFEQGMGKDPYPYFMRKVTGYFSFCAAAAFAQAARVFEPFDKARAKKYLERARNAYAYAVAHPDEPQPKFATYDAAVHSDRPQPKFSMGTNGGPDQGEGWTPKQYESAWCWAAGQLYATTGEQAFFDEFKKRAKSVSGGVAGSISNWGVLWGVLGTGKSDGDPALLEELRKNLLSEADKCVKSVEDAGQKGYRAPAPKGGGWGATSAVVKNIEGATRAYLLTKDRKYLDAMATGIDFTLGMNPSEMSWMTGAGSDSPMDPLNANSVSDGIEEPTPGILFYGATNYYKDNKSILYPDKETMGFYRRVVDVHGFPAGCEYSVWETQAPFVFAVGTLLPDKK
ncbi:MAG: glycoside hydrolase family 9 protein [Verrucomicrobiae bacterium]